MARQLGIEAALGTSRQGKLALWQVIARVIDQGSRLSAVRLAASHAACDIIGLDAFDEDDLYTNLDWLDTRQHNIEDRLFGTLPTPPGLYLYDVTGSYLEGACNELGAFGYNRDGKKLRLAEWVSPCAAGRILSLAIDQPALAEQQKLDGCYVLKTDLSPEQANAEMVHSRYKDLALVEWAFRTSKTVQLEMRPVHVRPASRTRGHALVVMLAYMIIRALASRWRDIDATVQEGLDELTTLCSTELLVRGQPQCNCIPQPRESVQRFLDKAEVRLPGALPHRGVHVATRKKLPSRRSTR